MEVLVTGANGHLGTNLVKDLLAAGHHVRASVRRLSDPARTEHLRALGPVELVEADLDRPPTLRAAMDGIEAVLHAAAVYALYAPGQDDAIVRASVAGIDATMRAAKDAGVKRVILTSSVAALPLTAPGAPPSDETMWASDLRVPYIRAKTEGERLAWKLADELGIDIASVLPGAFGGPGFDRNTPTIDLVEAIMKGALQLGAPPVNYPWVDVRDVSRAHIQVLEKGARGRYAAVNDAHPTVTEIATLLATIDPKIPRPLMTFPAFIMPILPWLEAASSLISPAPRMMTPELSAMLRGRISNISNAKIRRELGWEPRISLTQSLADTLTAIRTRDARTNAK
jgi:dihydroflavonol-4-reductase